MSYLYRINVYFLEIVQQFYEYREKLFENKSSKKIQKEEFVRLLNRISERCIVRHISKLHDIFYDPKRHYSVPLFSYGVVAACIVVCRVLLPSDQLRGVEQLTIGPRPHLYASTTIIQKRIFFWWLFRCKIMQIEGWKDYAQIKTEYTFSLIFFLNILLWRLFIE